MVFAGPRLSQDTGQGGAGRRAAGREWRLSLLLVSTLLAYTAFTSPRHIVNLVSCTGNICTMLAV